MSRITLSKLAHSYLPNPKGEADYALPNAQGYDEMRYAGLYHLNAYTYGDPKWFPDMNPKLREMFDKVTKGALSGNAGGPVQQDFRTGSGRQHRDRADDFRHAVGQQRLVEIGPGEQVDQVFVLRQCRLLPGDVPLRRRQHLCQVHLLRQTMQGLRQAALFFDKGSYPARELRKIGHNHFQQHIDLRF